MAACRKPRPGRRSSSSFSAASALPPPCADTGGLLSAAGAEVSSLSLGGQRGFPTALIWDRALVRGVPQAWESPRAWMRLIKAGPGSGPELCPLGSEKAQAVLVLLSPLGKMVAAGDDA